MSRAWEATKDFGSAGAELGLGVGAVIGSRLLLAAGVVGLFAAAGNIIGIATGGAPLLSLEGAADAVIPDSLGNPTELQASIAVGAGSIVAAGAGVIAVDTLEY
jgi:hypothetical protein